jgi:hypothetical protein
VSASPHPTGGRTVLVLLACLAVGSAAALAGGLGTSAPPATDAERPLTLTEAQRLAAMRRVNFKDARAGVHAVLGAPGAETYLAGWVDWRRPLLYVAVSGPGAAEARGLLQAAPGVLAIRPDASGMPAPTTAAGRPPAEPPGSGWRVRTVTASAEPLAALVALLFGLSRDQLDAADLLRHSDARWVGFGRAGGTPADVIVGPAVLPTALASHRAAADPSLAAMGGAVRFWLDDRARLHRLDALLAGGVPARVDLDRSDRPELVAIDALGGRPVRSRPVTAAEAAQLAGVRQRNRAGGGAALTVNLPTAPAVRGYGWVNWDEAVVYLVVRDADRPLGGWLLRADAGGVAVTAVPAGAARAADGGPPVPPPRDRVWTYRRWGQPADASGGPDLDLLINEVLWLASAERDDAVALRAAATWLRADEVAGMAVTVFEIPRPGDRTTGDRRLRYWVDAGGALRRLELRTGTGAFAQVDLEGGDAPAVPPVPTV